MGHQLNFDISLRCSLLHAHLWPSSTLAFDHIVVLLSPNFLDLKLTHSQLLGRLKSESKYKIAEGERFGARFLAHNTLRGRGAC